MVEVFHINMKRIISLFNLGLTLFITLTIISVVSMPVFPITPGIIALTFLIPSFTEVSNKNKCLVTNIFSIDYMSKKVENKWVLINAFIRANKKY